ncbi:hypothetical protein DFS34DRAFT_637396 [Phlyctochytrium arcticum]|nr:hypothetical protein DFS34DRAFT_637396 [Phlyctochytrium arcticum]
MYAPQSNKSQSEQQRLQQGTYQDPSPEAQQYYYAPESDYNSHPSADAAPYYSNSGMNPAPYYTQNSANTLYAPQPGPQLSNNPPSEYASYPPPAPSTAGFSASSLIGRGNNHQYSTKDKRYDPLTSKENLAAPTEVGDFDHDKDVGGQRYCCGCFKSRPACVGCCCFFLLFFLGGLGVAIFFLFPRMPDLVISDPYIPTSAEGFNIPKTGEGSDWKPNLFSSSLDPSAALRATPQQPFNFSIGLGVNITVKSDNYITIGVKTLTIQGDLLDASGKSLPPSTNGNKLVTTSVVKDIKFAGKATTTVPLPIFIQYIIVNGQIEQLKADPALLVILQACGLKNLIGGGGASDNKLRVNVKTTIDLAILSWTPFKLTPTRKVEFECPQQVSTQLTQVFGGLLNQAQNLLQAATNGNVDVNDVIDQLTGPN